MVAEKSWPLKEICQHQPGKYLARSAYENGPYKVFGSNSEMGYHHEPLYPGPMIVLARIGANAGALRYSNEPAWINNNASALIPDLAVDPRWLYYKLSTMSLEQYRAGTSQPFITLDALMSAPVDIPDRNTQVAIAGILGALDDKIELNRRMNATLEAMARALFQSWFVDFDPVHAKAEGRQPVGMDAETAALFPDSFEASVLGPIPKGWRVSTFGEIAENKELRLGSKALTAGIPYVGLDDVPRRNVALEQWDDADNFISATTPFKQGDVLFGKLRPYFHKVVVAPINGVCSTEILVLTPTSEEWRELMLGYAISDALIDYVSNVSNGTRMPRCKWSDLRDYELVLPPQNVAKAFNRFAQGAIQKIHHNARGSRVTAQLRDALLPKLITGELGVGGVAA